MKRMLAGLNSLFVFLSLSGSARAQEQVAPPQGASQAELAQSGPEPEQVAFTPTARVYSSAAGRWVYTVDRWVWVPAGATSVAIGGAPYVYLYTPGYGWAWGVSPWGWGGYRYGAWAGRPWRPQIWRGAHAVYPHSGGRGGFGHHGNHR
ncbi:MAG: hypothetical protein WBY94_26805 [Polyangiaceae bacterium]